MKKIMVYFESSPNIFPEESVDIYQSGYTLMKVKYLEFSELNI